MNKSQVNRVEQIVCLIATVSGGKRFKGKGPLEVEKVRKEKSKSNEMTQLGFKLKRKGGEKNFSQRFESPNNRGLKGDQM